MISDEENVSCDDIYSEFVERSVVNGMFVDNIVDSVAKRFKPFFAAS